MDRRLTWYILAGMILGVVVGYAVHIGIAQDNVWFEYATKTFKLLSDIFLNLIKLLVAPLILSTWGLRIWGTVRRSAV
jgi:Na+/H+-dicarboxylate symporter